MQPEVVAENFQGGETQHHGDLDRVPPAFLANLFHQEAGADESERGFMAGSSGRRQRGQRSADPTPTPTSPG